MMRTKGFKPVWSDAFMLGLMALAATPLFPATDRLPDLSISAPLGHDLYIATLLVCSFGFFFLRGRENEAAALEMGGLKKQITKVETEAAQHHADSEQQHKSRMAAQQEHHDTQMADAQEKHEAEMAASQELRQLVLGWRQQGAEAEAAHAEPIAVAGFNSAATLAEAFSAEEAFTMPYQLIQNRQRLIAPLQPYLGDDELPAPMGELQSAFRNLEKNPPTNPTTAMEMAKQISSLSMAIANRPSGYSIAERKAEVAPITMPSESSSGAHRPPKSSS